MSKYTYGLTDTGKITGFYFDNQLNNPLLTITLHANTELAQFEENGEKTNTSLGRFDIYRTQKGSKEVKLFDLNNEEVQEGEDPDQFRFDDGWVAWGLGNKDSCLSSILCQEWNARHPQDTISKNTHLSSMAPVGSDGKVSTIDADGIDWSGQYGYTPIATAILNEDFQINIQNSWTDVTGNNTLENMWKDLQPMAGVLGSLAPIVQQISDNTTGETPLSSALKSGFGVGASFMAGASQFLNSSLVVQGNRFTIYQGTNTDFANLSMKFTLFSDWEVVSSDENGQPKYNFITVNQKLNRLWPYFQGYYQSLSGDYIKFIKAKFTILKNQFTRDYKKSKNKVASSDSQAEETKENSGESNEGGLISDAVNKGKEFIDKVLKLVGDANLVDNVISKMVGFQDPPAGFAAINKNIDACQKGTFRLVFGGKYAIDNLVGGNMNVTLSKTIVKIPDTDSDDGIKFAPLSAEVVLNFKCASSFSNRVLLNILEGKGALKEGTADQQAQYQELFKILQTLHNNGGH